MTDHFSHEYFTPKPIDDVSDKDLIQFSIRNFVENEIGARRATGSSNASFCKYIRPALKKNLIFYFDTSKSYDLNIFEIIEFAVKWLKHFYPDCQDICLILAFPKYEDESKLTQLWQSNPDIKSYLRKNYMTGALVYSIQAIRGKVSSMSLVPKTPFWVIRYIRKEDKILFSSNAEDMAIYQQLFEI